jgi:hypothetical protein
MQLSPGTMHSTLTEATTGRVHLFRKWMSERVVQQGHLPAGHMCFAMVSRPGVGVSRMQGHELREDRLFLLRSGEEFTIQRAHARALLSCQAVRVPASALQRMRQHLLGSLSDILCVRHSMTTRSMYAEQDEGRQGGHGGVAVDPEGTH